MATVRIYKVAELLNTSSQEVIALLKRDHGIEVKSASSTIEEVVARQFVERLARQRNISVPSNASFADTPAVKGRKPAGKAPEPVKAAPALPPPRLVKTAKTAAPPPDVAEAELTPPPSAAAPDLPEQTAPAAAVGYAEPAPIDELEAAPTAVAPEPVEVPPSATDEE
ncbi:MAG: translation initiation factor IF-2 N-terminal domain-containing protein, partial [Vicinamibacterales bacterium]